MFVKLIVYTVTGIALLTACALLWWSTYSILEGVSSLVEITGINQEYINFIVSFCVSIYMVFSTIGNKNDRT